MERDNGLAALDEYTETNTVWAGLSGRRGTRSSSAETRQAAGSATAASGVATRKLNVSTRYRWTESASWAW
jgi:hypothetical protein